MKRLISLMSAMALLMLASTFALAQTSPAAGDWDVALNTPGGVRNFTVALKVDGEKLSGEIKQNKMPLTGTVKGSDVVINYTVKYMDTDLAITMTGKQTGDTMKGTVSFGGFAEDEWSAKRATGAAAAPSTTTSAPAANTGGKLDVTGAWEIEVQTDQGSGNPSFTLKQDGEKITGRYKGMLGESDVNGTVKGNDIEFSMKVSGQIEGTVIYKGTTDGKTMKGKVSLAGLGEGTFTGKKK
jgi:hypothetical protein